MRDARRSREINAGLTSCLENATLFTTIKAMLTTQQSPTNLAKTGRSVAMLDDLLKQALQRGFHGTVRLEITVQDGTIQHIRKGLEQLEK